MNGRLDFAVNGGDLGYNKNTYIEKLTEDRIVLAIASTNPIAEKKSVHPSDLLGLSFISHESNSQMYKLVESIIKELGMDSRITMTLGSMEAIKQAVAADLGISAIPFSAVSLELDLGSIKELKIDGKAWSYPYKLIYNKNRYLSPAVKKLMELVRIRMKTV